MIRIDLGKTDLERRQPKWKQLFSFKKGKGNKSLNEAVSGLSLVATIGLAGALAILPHLFLTQYKEFLEREHLARTAAIQDRSNQVDAEINRLLPFQRELESYEKQKGMVEGRIGKIRQLLSKRGTPVVVMDAVAQALPRKAWIKRLDFSLENESAAIKIEGQAFTNEEVADYLDKLSESIYLKDVRLESVISQNVDQIEMRGFEIAAHANKSDFTVERDQPLKKTEQ